MSQSQNDIVQYIDSAPTDQQSTLRMLRSMITTSLPGICEQLPARGFPVYTINEKWIAGFATRKKCPMFYIMLPEILDQYADQLGRLRSGKSCIEWRSTKLMSLEQLEAIAATILEEVAEGIRGGSSEEESLQ
ncbi:MAG: DUF1801 domain-containing protein [Planctomycetota bacterium]